MNPSREALPLGSAEETAVLDDLLDCCRAVLAADQATLERLRDAGFACAPGAWSFRLPELYGFLRRTAPGAIAQADYLAWRKALYASDLNRRLRALGGEVVVVAAAGHVDRTLYGLRATQRPGGSAAVGRAAAEQPGAEQAECAPEQRVGDQ